MSQPPQPIRGFLDLFSSIWLGVALLTILFFYCSIGSAGILYPTSWNVFDLDNWDQIVPRQHFSVFGLFTVRPEKTEYEWFVWWPFNLLIALICLNLVTATLRRIRFSVINLGVWMIHTGIITLCLGSVWYFSTKVEGDAPVFRRRIAINFAVNDGNGGARETHSLIALPGNRLTLNTNEGPYTFQVIDVDPQWEILSGDDAGVRAWSAMVRISTPQHTFVRQLIDGYPQYTEDVIPGEGRAAKVTGERFVDQSVVLSLDYAPQEWFYLVQTDALYLREVGTSEWTERPIHNLPRYSEYLTTRDEVWLPAGFDHLKPNPLGIAVPAAADDDPLPGLTFRVGSYLRYAVMQSRLAEGNERLNPYLRVRVEAAGAAPETIQMRAFDPSLNDVDPAIAMFDWIDDPSKMDDFRTPKTGTLTVTIPEMEVTEAISTGEFNLSRPEFRAIGDTGYSIRVREIRENMPVSEAGNAVSFAIVDIRTPQREFNRWVFDDPRFNRDQVVDPETGALDNRIEFDSSIDIQFAPGAERPLFHFIAGPGESNLRVVFNQNPAIEGQVFTLVDGVDTQLMPGLTVRVQDYWPRTRDVTKPLVVPPAMRNRNLDMQQRMVRLELPGKKSPVSLWLRYHEYPFASADAAMRGFIYDPARVTIRKDGTQKEYELIYSRRRAPLPATVVLDDFKVDWHVGGFTGENVSVENWHSELRFARDDGSDWSDLHTVAVNEPAEHSGYWFFQKMWDPPDPPGAQTGAAAPWKGLNYTVLGVGNRNGVHVQLAGCALAVLGMIYAFYVKPTLKRRRRDRVHASLERDSFERPGSGASERVFAASNARRAESAGAGASS